MKRIMSSILALLVLLGGLLWLIYAFQGHLLYPAPQTPPPATLPSHAQKLALEQSYAYLMLPAVDHQPAAAVIFTHGNAETAEMWLGEFETLREAGLAVLLVEYPGYGHAGGSPNLSSIKNTMLAAFDAISEHPAIDRKRIIAYGRSIGGGAAALLAKHRPVAALALESTFSTLAQLVKEKGFPSFLLKDRYNNLEVVAALEVPLYLYHGKEDDLIPFAHAQQLAAVAKDLTFHQEACGHNDCPRHWGRFLVFVEHKVK
ncbi:alpha/beta fold hydrolase [Aliiglaciecola sp. CAU 1673]|uniref:alpha/beta hydrolase n=1 Tax=Aliiglaciecola sp. CAU 1673 TaxID=3032595 RepID=UPI0023D9F880|nr:alpha/beta fold hydrolase [Aliiglaciecola sp. CAU 1673]MDF2177621.1 alpha/beta fold hydrolase [Aliiglaciecola sp. CAU 1673]